MDGSTAPGAASPALDTAPRGQFHIGGGVHGPGGQGQLQRDATRPRPNLQPGLQPDEHLNGVRGHSRLPSILVETKTEETRKVKNFQKSRNTKKITAVP